MVFALNWGLQHGTKVHKVKARKNLTVMLIADPTKNGLTLRIPKWVRFPLMILPVVMLLGALSIYSYIADLESQLAAEKSNVQSSAVVILDKDATIDALEITDDMRYEQLEGLATMAVALQNKLIELEDYKAVIDSKIGSTDKTTDSQPTRRSSNQEVSSSTSLGANEPVINIMTLTGTGEEDKSEEDDEVAAMTDDFSADVDALLEELSTSIYLINEEKDAYETRDEQLDELLPYWEAFPGVLPLADTYITSPYGFRRNPFGTSYEFHKGVDFKAYYQDIWATGSGVVTYAGYNNGYGYLVVIDHGYGLLTKYAHNSKLLVAEGDLVERYDVIAISGNSGRSSGPHLHYEVHENGETQDPMDYIYQGE